MMGSRRPPPRAMGAPHGLPPPQIQQFVAPKLWTMQIPKLPTEEPFIPDLQAPNGTELEEKLSVEMIEHGYRDPPMPNEFGNLRHYFRQRLADVADMRSRVGNEIDVLTWCIQARTKPTTVGDVYRPPSTSGTMNEAQKRDWMRLFVSPELRVNSLETIPHFKIDALIKCLYEFDVPYPKALWLIKAIFRDTRSMQQKDDFAQGLADAIKLLTQILYATSQSSSSNSYQPSTSTPGGRAQTGHSTPSIVPPLSQHTASVNHPPAVEQEHLSASTTNLAASMVISFPKAPPKTSSTLSPEQLNAKTYLAYVVRLLSWTHRDGFIPLDILTGGLATDFSPNISDNASCVYLSVLFQFLPDIIINSPALDKFKAILQHLADKFAAGPPRKDSSTNPRLRLFSLYCSTLKVLVSYLPDFLDPQNLEFLRQCISATYGELNTHSNSTSTVSSPFNTNISPFSGANSLQTSSMSLHGAPTSSGTPGIRMNGLAHIVPANLHPVQLSSLHLLYQNINANRTAIAVDAACYDHICNLLTINCAEGFPVGPSAPLPHATSIDSPSLNNPSFSTSQQQGPTASPISNTSSSGPFSSPLITALDLLDAFIRHLDLDELYNGLFGQQSLSLWAQQSRPGSHSAVSSNSSVYASSASIGANGATGTTENSSLDALERTIRLICSWAISPFRSGIHRIFVVSSLLRRFLAQNPGTSELIYDILFNFMDSEPRYETDILDASLNVDEDGVSFTKSSKSQHEKQDYDAITQIAIMIGELIRNRAFSHDKYLRILISRGILQSSSSSNAITSSSSSLSSSTSHLTGERHKAYLLNIPLFGVCKHDRNQRKITIQRYLPNVTETLDLSMGVQIVNKMLLRRQNSLPTSKPPTSSQSAAMDVADAPDAPMDESPPLDMLVQMPLYCRYATGQYAIHLVKWILSFFFRPSVQGSADGSEVLSSNLPMEPKPIELTGDVNLLDLSLSIKSLIQTLYVILEHASDFRSMIELSRWLLDRVLLWDFGEDRDEVVNCVVALLKSYEHVLFALDIPLVPLLERLLILALRWNVGKDFSQNMLKPVAAPARTAAAAAAAAAGVPPVTTFLLKLISKRSSLKSVASWTSEKAGALDSLRRLASIPSATSALHLKKSSATASVVSADAATQNRIDEFLRNSIHFDLDSPSPSAILIDAGPIPSIPLTTPSAALYLLEAATDLWSERVKKIGNPLQTGCLSTSSSSTLDFFATPTLQLVLAQSLSVLPASVLRNVMVSLIWGAKWKALLASQPDKTMQKNLASWIDSLCTAFAFSGENILSMLTKLMKLIVDGFSSVEPSFFSFVMRLMKALSVCSFPRGERCEHKAATRWLHSLGRPIKKNSLQYFVLFCNHVANSENALSAVQSTKEADPSTDSLLWFLGESLLNLPPEDVHSIFKSLGDSSRAFNMCSRIFDSHSESFSNSGRPFVAKTTTPRPNPLDANFLLDLPTLQTYIASTLDHTNVWSVRFTWLQLQLLLDAGQEKERQMTSSGASSSASMQSGQRVNEVFASTLMYKLSANQLHEGGAGSSSSSSSSGSSSSSASVADSVYDDYQQNNSDAILNMLRRLDANVRLEVLNYIFSLLDPKKSLQRYYLSTALLGPKIDLHRSTDEAPTLSLPGIEKRLVEVLLTTASCCLDSQTPFPIEYILESHMQYIEVYVLPHMGDFSKWHQIRIQLYIRLSLIRWILPSENDSTITPISMMMMMGQTQSSASQSSQNQGERSSLQGQSSSSSSMQGVLPTQAANASGSTSGPRGGASGAPGTGILDKLVVLLLRLLASPALQESVLDGKDLWTLALHTFAALKNCQKSPATRRALTELYPTLTMPSHLRIRLEPVLQSVARKDRPIYLNNASRVLLPKGLDATRQLEEQPEAALLSAFGARRIPSRPLTYANHLLSSSQRQSSSQSSGSMGGGVPSVVGGGIVAGGGTHVPQPHQQQHPHPHQQHQQHQGMPGVQMMDLPQANRQKRPGDHSGMEYNRAPPSHPCPPGR